MTEVNGPYFIEEIEYVRDAQNRETGVLLMTAAEGVQFASPMSVSQLQALLGKLRRELETP